MNEKMKEVGRFISEGVDVFNDWCWHKGGWWKILAAEAIWLAAVNAKGVNEDLHQIKSDVRKISEKQSTKEEA